MARKCKKTNTYVVLLGRHMRRWEDNIKMDLKKIS